MRGALRARSVALAGMVACLAGWPAAPLAAQAADREVVGLGFEGNRVFGDSQLAASIATAETTCKSFLFIFPLPLCPLTDWAFAHRRAFLDEEEIPRDLLRLRVFYRQRGYREVRVDTAVTRLDGKVEVTFDIEEGEPVLIDSLAIEGLEDALDLERLRRAFPLEPGDPFDLVRLESGKQLIRERLLNRGHIDAVILEDTYLPPGEGARIALRVDPGPRVRVGEIVVTGAERIDHRVVRRFLAFRSGDHYDQRELLESQRNLYRLDALRFADVSRAEDRAAGDTTVDIGVRVTEAAMRTVRVGGGMSTTECALGEVRFTHRNFAGAARRLDLTGRLSNLFARDLGGTFPCTDVGRADVFQDIDFRLRAEVQQPFLFSSRNRFRAALFHERESFPDIFVRTSSGGELAVTREIHRRMPATLSYRLELTGFAEESADIFFCINFGFCQPDDIRVLTERRLLSPLALTWRYDRTDVPFSPTRGYYASLELERADRFTGSDYQYVRAALEVADFEGLGGGLTAAARIRGGVVHPTGGLAFDPDPGRAADIVHPRKRFFAGGAQSVRGFGQNLLGPRVLAIDSVRQCAGFPLAGCADSLARADPGAFDQRPAGGNAAFEASLEIRQGLGGAWILAAFLDVGQVWRELDELEAPVLTPGAGIRYRSPVGPLRFDLGYNPTGAAMLPVVVQLPDGEIRELEERVPFEPFSHDDPGPFREFLRRLQFHISIGEAF